MDFPSEDQLILARAWRISAYGSSSAYVKYEFKRRVLVDGLDFGAAIISFRTKDEPGTSLLARPYFDPAAKEVRLHDRGGLDVGARKTLLDCASASALRPLLHLAHSEGLLDRVPGKLTCLFVLNPCDC